VTDAMHGETVGLVGCGRLKRPGTWPAGDLYTGPLFVMSLAYAARHCHHVYVLSAKWGLLTLDKPIESYDERLPTDRDGIAAWARNVECSLRLAHLDEGTDGRKRCAPLWIIALAGADYIDPVRAVAKRTRNPWRIDEPLRGMAIGHRLRWLKAQLAAQPELPL